MAERFELTSVTHDRPRRRLAAGMGVLAASAFIVIALAALTGPIGALLALFLALIVGGRVANRFGGRRSVVGAEIIIENGILQVPGLVLEVRGEGVRQGIESAAGGTVVLDLANDETLRLRSVPGDDSGERILAALGVGALQRTTRVPLRRMLGRFTIGLVTFFLGLLPASIVGVQIAQLLNDGVQTPGVVFPLAFGLSFLLTAAVVRRFGAPHVVIGSDGIRIRGLLGQPFIRYSEILRARQDDAWTIRLELANGRRRRLPVVAVDPARVAGLVERIERARRRASDGRSFLSDSLARAGRSAADWHASLERLAQREATFREAPLDRDEVERIAADPDAKPDQRIGAAFVLTRIAADAGRERIRIAADATADEDLKAALLAAAEGELDADVVERSAKRVQRA